MMTVCVCGAARGGNWPCTCGWDDGLGNEPVHTGIGADCAPDCSPTAHRCGNPALYTERCAVCLKYWTTRAQADRCAQLDLLPLSQRPTR